MAKMGRPTQYNEELAKKIISYIATGVSKKVAADFAGVPYEVLLKWFKRKPEFVRECDKARATKIVLAHKNELERLQNGDRLATSDFLKREEMRRHNREMERHRKEEIRNKKSNMEIVSHLIDMNEIVNQINGDSESDDGDAQS